MSYRVDRQDVMSLVRTAKNADHETLENLSQTDKKTLNYFLEKLKENPDLTTTEIDKSGFESLKARLTGEGTPPLGKEWAITRIFLRITGKYIKTKAVEQKLEETYKELYDYHHPYSSTQPKEETMKNTALDYKVELRRLRDDPNNRNLSKEKKLQNAKDMLSRIARKEKEWGLDGQTALLGVKNKVSEYIAELEKESVEGRKKSLIEELKEKVKPLSERKVTVNPPEKKVRFASEVVVHEFKKNPPVKEAEVSEPRALAAKVSQGDPSLQRLAIGVNKITATLREGKIFRAIAGLELLRRATAARLPEHSERLSRLKERFVTIANKEVSRLREAEEISETDAEILIRALELTASSDTPLQESKERAQMLEKTIFGKKLQENLSARFSKEKEQPQQIMEQAQPPKETLEVKIFQEHVSAPLIREAVAQPPMEDVVVEAYKPVDVPKGLADILIKIETDEAKALTFDQLMLGYKRAVKTEDLFGAIRNALHDDNVPVKQKTTLVNFVRNWLNSGLFDNEVEKVRPLLVAIIDDAHKISELELDEEYKNLNDATNSLNLAFSNKVKTVEKADVIVGGEVEKKEPKTVEMDEFIKRVKNGKYGKKDVQNYAAGLTNHVLDLLDGAKMDEMFVPNTKENFSTDATHLSQVLNFQMKITDHLQRDILNTLDPKERKNLFEFYCKVAKQVWESGDVGTATALVTALANSDVEKTLKEEFGVKNLSEDARFPNDLASDLIMPSKYAKRVRELREQGVEVIEPLMKFWGVYAAADEMETRLEDGSINPDKIFSLAQTVKVVRDFKSKTPIESKVNIAGLIDAISATEGLSDIELHQLYLTNFPRKE